MRSSMLRAMAGLPTLGLAIILAGCWQVPKNYTLLHWAARENHIDIVRSLVEKDVDVDAGDDVDRRTDDGLGEYRRDFAD